MGKERVHTTSVPSSVLHAPQAVRSGPFVFVSGLYATDFKTGIAVRSDPTFPFVGKTDIELQTEYILGNLRRILQAAGTGLDHVGQGGSVPDRGRIASLDGRGLAGMLPPGSPGPHGD